MRRSTIPVLLRGFLGRESLDQARAEIERATGRSGQEAELLLVISSEDGDIRPSLEFVRHLVHLKIPIAAKVYTAEGPAALIALTTQRRQIVSRGVVSINLGMVEIEASELDEAGALRQETHRLFKDYVDEVYSSVKRLAGISAAQLGKLSAGGSLRLSPSECLAAGIVERVIY
jgi:hypothetical protein